MFIARAKQREWDGGEDGGSKVKWKDGGTSSKVLNSKERHLLEDKLLVRYLTFHYNQSRKTVLHDSSVFFLFNWNRRESAAARFHYGLCLLPRGETSLPVSLSSGSPTGGSPRPLQS